MGVVAGLLACADDDPRDRPEPEPPTLPGTGAPTDPTWNFAPEVVLAPAGDPTQVANVRLAPLDWGPGLELVVAEANPPALTWVGCLGDACTSEPLPLPAGLLPARTATADLDADGDADLIVSVIGELGPTNYLVGSLWVLWRDGAGFVAESLATNLPRFVCAEPGDLDGDGDLDLTMCGFGHNRAGAFGWLEQAPAELGWRWHPLDQSPGMIHAHPVDVDGDGDLDLLGARAQLDEQLLLYRNLGGGEFVTEVVFEFPEPWYGVSGVEPVDLDQDGDVDALFTNGDTMDSDLPVDVDPNEVHGLRWFENDGAGRFTEHLLASLWGAYAVRAADLDGDDDLDVVLGCLQRTRDLEAWNQPSELHVLENDGAQGFVDHPIPGAAPQLVTLELGDADQDGDLDVFTASLHVEDAQPSERLVLLRRVP